MAETPLQSRVRELLCYNKDTGIFTWKVSRGRVKEGSVAGYAGKDGYIQIGLDGKLYNAHRLAYLYYVGYMPSMVDHINGDKQDNRWSNLRPCSKTSNGYNSKLNKSNKSGVKGVSWHKTAGKWRAQLDINGKTRHLGLFEDKEEAIELMQLVREEAHEEFARHV